MRKTSTNKAKGKKQPTENQARHTPFTDTYPAFGTETI